MARELRLDKSEVAELRRTKQPLTADLVTRLAEAHGVNRDEYAASVGEPIDTFYNKVVCATKPVTTDSGEAMAPLAYGSALAGFLLARVVADRDGDHRRFRMDVIKGLATPMRTNPRPRDGCQYCGNAMARKVYDDRWGASSD